MGKEEYAWRDMSVVVAGRFVATIQNITYTTERDLEYVHGAGDDPHSIQKGNKRYPVEIMLLQSDIEAMIASAQSRGARDLTDTSFDIVVHYAKNIGDARVTDIIPGFSTGQLPKGWNQGDPKMEITLTGISMPIKYNV